jgi:SAM-dependent methyltransferase
MDRVPDEIINHYRHVEEDDRLRTGSGLVEFLRTQEVLRRNLPRPPAAIVDVGGATGIHASWLADDGYRVHLVDIVDKHVAAARNVLTDKGIVVHMADGRALPFRTATFAAALLLGPLYHLTSGDDRAAALLQARRVVRPGGIVAIAAVNRHASLFDGLCNGRLTDPQFAAIVAEDISTGQHRNPTERDGWWTTAYFHRPQELREEVEGAGLHIREFVGLEGLAAYLPEIGSQLDSEEGRKAVLWAAGQIEAEPTLLGLSAHLLVVAEVPV